VAKSKTPQKCLTAHQRKKNRHATLHPIMESKNRRQPTTKRQAPANPKADHGKTITAPMLEKMSRTNPLTTREQNRSIATLSIVQEWISAVKV